MAHNQTNIGRPLLISILIWINGILGFRDTLNFLLYFTPAGMGAGRQELRSYFFSSLSDFDLAIAYLITGVISLLAMYGLLNAKKWVVFLQKIIAIPYFFMFPLGTIYALAIVIGFRQNKVKRYFQHG